MNQIKSLSGRTYILDRNHPIGKGGEAQLFSISNYSGAVAKLYTQNLCNSHRERKLMAMLQIPLSDELETELAWPKDILYDHTGKLLGFVMRKISGSVPLNTIFSDESYHLLQRITIAKNLCITINHIHKAALVIGDLNPYNILVLETGLVRLIDTDSFHIKDNQNRTFRCEVCIPEFISPRVSNAIPKGETLKTVSLPTYTQDSDEYALAILIFMILMNATHPYTVALAKGNDNDDTPQPIDLMKRYNFPYDKCPYGMKLPVYALPFKMLSERLRFMFIKSFSKGESISAEIWYDALCDFEEEISRTCKVNPNHKYRKGLRKCPYCDTLKRTELFFKNQKKKH